VLSLQGGPVVHAEVLLLDTLGHPIQAAASDREGRFRLPDVPPGV
jgi:hypothetical protein